MGDILQEISDVAAELADGRQHTERIPYWDAQRNRKHRTHVVVLPGLLGQLYESVIPGSAELDGARSHPASKPPLALEALSAHTVISLAAAKWCWDLRLDQRDSVEGNIRALVGAAPAQPHEDQRAILADLKRWRTMCAVMTGWEHVECFPEVPCMGCGWLGPTEPPRRGALRVNVTTGRAYCTNQETKVDEDGAERLVCGRVWSQSDGSIQMLGRYIAEVKKRMKEHSLTVVRRGKRFELVGEPVEELWMTDEFMAQADPQRVEVAGSSVTFRLDNVTLEYELVGRDDALRVHVARYIRGLGGGVAA